MAIFPSIKPNGRSLVIGNFPQTEYTGTSGVSTRFIYSLTYQISYSLSLTYSNLLEVDITALYNHYDGQQGSLLPFALPAVIWAGYSSVPVDAATYEWRYIEPLQIVPSGINRFNTTVSLESVIVY